MSEPHENVARDILIADEEPRRDQRLDERASCRSRRDLAEQHGTCRDLFIARAHGSEGSQHRRQRLLHLSRERFDDFVGAARDRSFEATERAILGKGEDTALATCLVQRIEHELEKRQ